MKMTLMEMNVNLLTELYEATMESCANLEPEQKVKLLHDTAAVFCVANNKIINACQKENDNHKE